MKSFCFQLSCFWNLSQAINYISPLTEDLGGEHLLVNKNYLGENIKSAAFYLIKWDPKLGSKMKAYEVFFLKQNFPYSTETFQKDLRNVSQLKKWNISKMLRNISARSLKDLWKVKMSVIIRCPILPHEIFQKYVWKIWNISAIFVQYMRNGFKCISKIFLEDTPFMIDTWLTCLLSDTR